jgi:putative ribosome biogenesis GTPase RsgA
MIGKHLIIFIGRTGVGKSTTTNYLLGIKLENIREKITLKNGDVI